MATLKNPKSSKIVVKVETGTNGNGSAKYSDRPISNVDPALPDDDARTIAAAYGALQMYPVGAIVRQDTSYLEEN